MQTSRRKRARTGAKVEAGSTNVFEDLGFPNAIEMAGKAELVRFINSLIEQRGYSQVEAAKILGVHQPKISYLKRGRLTEFSVETLFRFLLALDQTVDINVHSAGTPRSGPTLHVLYGRA